MFTELMISMDELTIDLSQFILVAQGECTTSTEGPRKDVGH